MTRLSTKRNKRIRRHVHVRATIKGTADRPRLSVFRSNRYMIVQLIDDIGGKTLAYASDSIAGAAGAGAGKSKKTAKKEAPIARAFAVGEQIAKLAGEKKISAIVFDRGGYRYHGRVKAVAEGARKGGIKF